ncbi:MAG TPA: endonuclease/exonuclease/phosphatase family protein [Saprospiraceae bacterium]|nr:endonuclease/exonuclease/phosphatase family protein [Saprospiraceae bacterium]
MRGQPNTMKLNTAIEYGAASLLILVTLLCIFTPEPIFFKQFAAYTLYIMLGLLGAGLLFFVFNQNRLMMVSLLCCCGLNLYLKESSNNQLRLAAVTSNPSLRITHVSLGNAESDYDSVIDYLLRIDADFLSFQELTPDWNTHLTDRLSPTFRYVQTLTRLDQYGMGFFSKLPFQKIDTIYHNDIPNLVGTTGLSGRGNCQIISCQVVPPVNQAAFMAIDDHLRSITSYMSSLEGSTVVLGDFHLPPWSAEVQNFKVSAKLQDGRRDIHPRNIDGSLSMPRIPVEHILFTDEFECTSFSEIGNAVVGRIGITGTYQLQEVHEEMTQ